MTVVIAAAAGVAVLLFIAIMLIGRSRSDDEVERFKRVSNLTSQWSRQQQSALVREPAPAHTAPSRSGPIDLRDSAQQADSADKS